MRRYQQLHPELDPASILRGIDRSVREAAPDIGRIAELYRHPAS